MTGGPITTTGAAVALAAALTAGCGGSDPASGQTGDPDELTGELVVFAAASLTESFTQIGDDFETANPGVTVAFSFAGSATLAQQINQGAPADVFASASPANMQTATDAGDGGTPTTFARNRLVIAVPAGNPGGVAGLADLADPDVKVALCAEQVPCGAAARTALEAAGVEITPVTLERDVRATLSKLTLGEVDAALVYRTDVAGASGVEGIEFPESANAINDCPIVVLAGARNQPAGQAFVDHVLAGEGQAVLAAAGFQPP
jgi:molybdate transport system substrate-binding protein